MREGAPLVSALRTQNRWRNTLKTEDGRCFRGQLGFDELVAEGEADEVAEAENFILRMTPGGG
jgi:hypothetical protein